MKHIRNAGISPAALQSLARPGCRRATRVVLLLLLSLGAAGAQTTLTTDAELAAAMTVVAEHPAVTCDPPATLVDRFDLKLPTLFGAGEPRPASLYQFLCWSAAYNQFHVFVLSDEHGAQLVPFASPLFEVTYVDGDSNGEVEAITITGFTTIYEIVNAYVDVEIGAIGAFFRWRGVSDASDSTFWHLEDGRFVLSHFEVDATYDGEFNPETILDYR